MSIQIEKRTRTSINDIWSSWAIVNESAPFTNTDLVQYRVSDTITLDVSDLTNNVTIDNSNSKNILVSGSGIFDDLMETISKHVASQYDSGRILAEDYSTVYLGALQTTLQESVKFLLQSKAAEKNLDVLKAQERLYKRQAAGFDDNKYQKILETMVSSWATTFQDTDTTFIPGQLTQDGTGTIGGNPFNVGFGFNQAFDQVNKDYTE